MKDLKGHRVFFRRADLDHFDDGQLKIIAVFPHIANRLLILESQVYSHQNVAVDESQQVIVREAAACAFVESIILIAGELKEAWEAIQQCYHHTKVSKTMNASLPPLIQESLKRIPSYFAGDSLVMHLRNNFAYHNSPEVALQAIRGLAPDDEMVFYYLAELDEYSMFYFDFASRIRTAALAKWLGVEHWTEIIEPLMVGIMGQMFNDVCLAVTKISHELLQTIKPQHNPVTLDKVAGDKEIRAAVFTYQEREPEKE